MSTRNDAIESILFEIRDLAAQEMIGEYELTHLNSDMHRAVAFRMVRRIAVNEQTFKMPDKTSTTESAEELMHVEVCVPSSVWDHMKYDWAPLRWMVNRGWLSPPEMDRHDDTQVFSYTCAINHYNVETTVLTDASVVGRNQHRIEMQYMRGIPDWKPE